MFSPGSFAYIYFISYGHSSVDRAAKPYFHQHCTVTWFCQEDLPSERERERERERENPCFYDDDDCISQLLFIWILILLILLIPLRSVYKKLGFGSKSGFSNQTSTIQTTFS